MDDIRGENSTADPDYAASIAARGAAGVFLICRSTRRALLGLRSGWVEMPHHWGGFGGAIDEGETPEDAVRREIAEELGYRGSYSLHRVYRFEGAGFTYQNFVGVVEEEFDGVPNWEHDELRWFELDALPENIHPGLSLCLKDPATASKIQSLLGLNENVEDWVVNPSGLNPAFLTFDEYHELLNPNKKSHCSSAYNQSLSDLNDKTGFDEKEFPRHIQTITRHGIPFRIKGTKDRFGVHLVVINPEGQRVAQMMDEWGCSLVQVAKEYRSFGLGEYLTGMVLKLTPTRPSGGETPGGKAVLRRAHAEAVRDALKSGWYREMVKKGEMTPARVKEITGSLTRRAPVRKKNRSTNDPSDWLLYWGDATFIVYDRKLREALAEDWDFYWQEQCIKGMVHFSPYEHHSGTTYAIVHRFGGDTRGVRTLLVSLAAEFCHVHGETLLLDVEDIDSLKADAFHFSEVTTTVGGYPRVEVTNRKPVSMGSLKAMAQEEKIFRDGFDEFDEFFYQMMEMADAKYQTPIRESIEPAPIDTLGLSERGVATLAQLERMIAERVASPDMSPLERATIRQERDNLIERRRSYVERHIASQAALSGLSGNEYLIEAAKKRKKKKTTTKRVKAYPYGWLTQVVGNGGIGDGGGGDGGGD